MVVTMTTTEARKDLATVVNDVAHGKKRAVLTRRGKVVAAIIPIEDLRLLEQLEDQYEDQQDALEAERVLANPDLQLYDWEDVKQRLGL